MATRSAIADPAARRGASLRVVLASPALALFLALFASQAGVLVLSPILSDVADDFGVSIATAGQLRIVAAPLAAAVALLAARSLVRFSPRALLGAGSTLVSLGSVASALAPSFAALVLAQVPLWAGISLLLTAAIAASAAWSTPESRTRVVASMYAGPPAAWIVGMPLIGVVAEVDWRLAFLVLPLPAALLAGFAAAGRPHDAPLAATGTSLRDLGLGGHARLQRRAPDGRIWHDDDGHRRRAGRRRGRVPARQPAGRPQLARQGAVDDARDERRRRGRR